MENIHALVGEIKKGVTFVFINFYQILASPFWMTRAKMLEVKNLEKHYKHKGQNIRQRLVSIHEFDSKKYKKHIKK